jgi:hypothetical protein
VPIVSNGNNPGSAYYCRKFLNMPELDATDQDNTTSSSQSNTEEKALEFLEKSRNQKSALIKLLRFVEGKTILEANPETNQGIEKNNSSLT